MSFPMLAAMALAATAPPHAIWSGGNSVARAACIKAVGLSGSTASSLVVFSDDHGAKTAVLVNGRYRPHNGGGAMLCLYDRRTRFAEAQDAKGWRWAR